MADAIGCHTYRKKEVLYGDSRLRRDGIKRLDLLIFFCFFLFLFGQQLRTLIAGSHMLLMLSRHELFIPVQKLLHISSVYTE